MSWMLLLLAGCLSGPDAYTWRAQVEEVPLRAGDPLRMSVAIDRTWWGEPAEMCDDDRAPDSPYGCEDWLFAPEPLVEDADGEPVSPVPLYDAQGEVWSWTVDRPGDYTVVGLAEAPGEPLQEAPGFEVAAWELPPVDADLEGATWVLLDYRFAPLDLGPSIQSTHPPLILETSGVDATGATIRVAAAREDGFCQLWEQEAFFEDGRLAWSEQGLSVPEPNVGALRIDRLGVSVAWREGDPDVADARLGATLDTRPLDAFTGDEDGAMCDLAEELRGDCIPCEDGVERCVRIRGYGGTLLRSSTTLPADLPACHVDLEEVEVQLQGIDCQNVSTEGSTAGACSTLALRTTLPAWVLGLGLLFRRRSRGG